MTDSETHEARFGGALRRHFGLILAILLQIIAYFDAQAWFIGGSSLALSAFITALAVAVLAAWCDGLRHGIRPIQEIMKRMQGGATNED